MDAGRGGAKSSNLADWSFGLSVLGAGVLNLLLVHPVPAMAYVLVSLVYLPPVSGLLGDRFVFRVPTAVKIVLGIGWSGSRWGSATSRT